MAIKTILTKAEYDALPDSIPKAEVYGAALGDGRVRIDGSAVDGWAVEDVVGLKTTLGKKSADAAKYAEYAELGVPASEARELIAKARAMKDWTPEEKAREARDAAIRDVEKKYQERVAALEGQVASLDKESDTYVRDAKLIAALAPHAVDPEKVAKLLSDQVRKVRKDGKLGLVVVDANGNPRISMKPGQSGDMQPEELIEEWRGNPANSWMMKPNGVSGAGTQGSAGPASAFPGSRRVPESEFKNPIRYAQLKEEFAKAGVTMDQVEIVRGA